MKVILSAEVENLGNAGELVTVKDGYARNFLIPRQLAVRADERNVRRLDHQKRTMEARRHRLQAEANSRAGEIERIGRVVVIRSAGADGKLFGSVTNRDIAEAFAQRGVTLDRRHIVLDEPLKALGDFDVVMKLGQGVTSTIKVSVEPDEESAKLMAEAAAAAKVPERVEPPEHAWQGQG